MESTGQSGPGGSSSPGGQTGSTAPAGSGSQPPNWQSTPTSPPPAAPQGGGGGGTPSWTASLTSTAPVAGPAGYFYGDVPNRIIAYIIDAIILFVIYVIVGAVLGGILPRGELIIDPNNPFNTRVDQPFATTIIFAIVNLLITGAYFIYTWMNLRGSPGMRVLGMQVGNETDGASLTMNQAITRYLLLGAPFGIAQAFSGASSLSVIIGLIALIYFIALLVTTAQSPTKQGLHDKYAHTVVVKAARAVS